MSKSDMVWTAELREAMVESSAAGEIDAESGEEAELPVWWRRSQGSGVDYAR